ncbi:Uncharacterised protein [Bordetella pertussis]|nr:Uncharacterised protein [Bordetella pertussis]
MAALQRVGQFQPVQRLDFGDIARHVLGLVGLQVSDHDPLQVQVGQLRRLVADFLGLVLAETPQAQRRGVPDCLDGKGLAYRQQRHAFGRTCAAFTGGLDAGLDGGQPVRHRIYFCHAVSLVCAAALRGHVTHSTHSLGPGRAWRCGSGRRGLRRCRIRAAVR